MSIITLFPSRKTIDILNPNPDDISLEDIAHSLSIINRYGGHTKYPYSVLSHSIQVGLHIKCCGGNKKQVLAGLLHDASEYICGDVVTPLKHSLQDYMAIENNVQSVIFNKFGLSYPYDKMVHDSDRFVISDELFYLKDIGSPNKLTHPIMSSHTSHPRFTNIETEYTKSCFLEMVNALC